MKKQRLLFALAFVLLGVAMEGMQSLDPKRYAEFNDVVANTFGVALGILLTKKSLKNILIKLESRFFS
jgi:VanZ family protein